MKKLRFALTLIALNAAFGAAHATTHTWIPRSHVMGTGPGDVQTVIVIGTAPSITFGSGDFDQPFTEVAFEFQGGNGIANAIASGTAAAVKLSNACSNPLISAEAKSVTGGSDTTNRWLAAQEIYNSIATSNLLPMYYKAFNGMSIVINGQRFSGFKVTYSDGASETWAVNPGAATSVVKLFDTPMPGSLTEGKPGEGCKSS